MATHDLDITGLFSPDPANTAGPFAEWSTVLDSNDRYPHMVWAFPDSGTKLSMSARFKIPQNYIGTPKLIVQYRTTATSGNLVLDYEYTAIATGESGDPSADQETGTATDAVPGTARLFDTVTFTLTGSNFAVADNVLLKVSRDGADGADTLAATCYVEAVIFQYADA